MSQRPVTVATFAHAVEAQLARNLLEAEGITAYLANENNVFPGAYDLVGRVGLQVAAEDAPRAVGLLAAVEATLDDDWEAQAEKDVWVCSLCGTPVSTSLSVCYACETPRESIQAPDPAVARRPRSTTEPRRTGDEIQSAPASRTVSDKVHVRDLITAAVPEPTAAVAEDDPPLPDVPPVAALRQFLGVVLFFLAGILAVVFMTRLWQ
jgi:hypothetical protein